MCERARRRNASGVCRERCCRPPSLPRRPQGPSLTRALPYRSAHLWFLRQDLLHPLQVSSVPGVEQLKAILEQSIPSDSTSRRQGRRSRCASAARPLDRRPSARPAPRRRHPPQAAAAAAASNAPHASASHKPHTSSSCSFRSASASSRRPRSRHLNPHVDRPEPCSALPRCRLPGARCPSGRCLRHQVCWVVGVLAGGDEVEGTVDQEQGQGRGGPACHLGKGERE